MESEPARTDARIVVGVDGSEQSRLALRWAARLAPVLQARVVAVMAWHFPPGFTWGVPDDWDPQDECHRSLATTIASEFGDEPPAGLKLFVSEGMPAKVLLDASGGARMLVVGRRGHGGFTGLLLGSVSSAVAEHADCPVLVVHPGSDPDASLSATGSGR